MRHLSAIILCAAALSAPALAAAQDPAPLKMGLITAGIDRDVAASLERVIAASPQIERLPAAAPPSEDADAARAAWLRANGLEGALLAEQVGAQITLIAVGPLGEVLGREALPAGVDDAQAQRALQRATGLIGPPVLVYRRQRALAAQLEQGVAPGELPRADIEARTSAMQRGWFGLGLLAAPLHRYARTSAVYSGEPRPDRSFAEAPMVASLWLGHVQGFGDPYMMGSDGLWYGLAGSLSLAPGSAYRDVALTFGGVVRGDDSFQVGLGFEARYESFEADDSPYQLSMITFHAFDTQLRWLLVPDRLALQLSAYMQISTNIGDPETLGGIGLGGRAELLYLISDLLYVELRAQTAHTWFDFGTPLWERLDRTLLAFGVGIYR